MAKKHVVIVDLEKCTGCGLCKNDCVGFDIQIQNGKANPKGNSCIHCGHCEAICPNGAIKLTGFEDQISEFTEQTRLDPQQLLEAIKTRRTIRQFTQKQIPQEVLDMIFEAGRLAPTGTNSQGTSFILLQEKLNECEALAVGIFKKLLNIGKKLIPALASMEISSHFFFKNAPLAIIVFGKDKVSASLAAQNMAFMAEAHGLGVLFSGFFSTCVNHSHKLRKIMGIPKESKVVTTLVVGYPAVKYHRTAHREPIKLKKS